MSNTHRWPLSLLAKLNRPAEGGNVSSPNPHDEDSIHVRLSPGYVSFDNGETWHEVPDKEEQ